MLPIQAAVQDLEAVDFSVVAMARKLRALLTTEVQQKAPEGKAMGMATDKELRSMDFPITSWLGMAWVVCVFDKVEYTLEI